MRLSGFHVQKVNANSLTSGCNVYLFYFLYVLASHFFVSVLSPFVPSLFFSMFAVSLNLSFLSLISGNSFDLKQEGKKKSSTSTDLATACFSLCVFCRRFFLLYFTVTFAQGRHSLPAAVMQLLSFLSFLYVIDWGCVSSKTPILPPFSHSVVSRLAISVPAPPLRQPSSSHSKLCCAFLHFVPN